MIVELLFLMTSALWASPLFSAAPAGAVLPALFSVKQQARGLSGDKVDKLCDLPGVLAKNEDKPMIVVKHRHVLVVLIHGTLFPVPSLDSVQEWAEGWLKKDGPDPLSYTDVLREKSFLSHQPIGLPGMQVVFPEWSGSANGAQLMGWLMQEMYKVLPPEEFALVHSYTFGWDGNLSLKRRKAQARGLLKSLEDLVTEYKDLYPNDDVETMVLAHSHGGNVALHMADWSEKAPKFFVDKLVMFGTPVHGDTEHLLVSPLFKQVYNVHSNGDYIQVADIFSTKKYNRARIFKHESVLNAPQVKQILVQAGEYNPNHSELWFFKRPSVLFFRSTLPTAPLPIAAFTPLMLYQLKKANNAEHFLKLNINLNPSVLSMNLVPFKDYSKGELVRLHQYEERFDISSLYSKFSLIQKE